MTNEQKELLIRDICARLSYGVKIRIEYPFLKEEEWHPEMLYGLDLQRFCIANTSIELEIIKPYLFPMSSMNERLREEHKDLWDNDGYRLDANDNIFTLQDFYCKYHIDYRGLISMGLALDATGLKIY